ncbi:MAG: amino acid adenylation domain-containing protein, partial [Planctomycetes bacterium]|nr:amino acid adenylation domain-containing protein [Planctomycetota bacterium]
MDDYDVESHSVADAHRNECTVSNPTEGCLARPSSLDRRRFEIPADVAANLKKTSQSHGIEIAALLLAAFKWTLSRYSGHKEPRLSNPSLSFLELANHLSSQDHVFIDSQKLWTDLTEIDFPKSQGSPFVPECKVRFLCDSSSISRTDLGNEFGNDDADISLFIRSSFEQLPADCLRGQVDYKTDLWDQSSIERLIGHLLHVLSVVSLDVQVPISGISILSQSERDQLIHQFNDTYAEYPKHLCVHELFELQVDRNPDSVALVFEDQQLTYSELNARANRLARFLQSQGVNPQSPVGLCLDRSLDLVVSILAILKAGAVYVPLDPDYPAKRLERMIRLSHLTHLVTHSSLADALPVMHGGVVLIDQVEFENDHLDSNSLGIIQLQLNPAYVIFTSGSSGDPNGVIISHQSLLNLLLDVANRVGFSAADSLLSVTTPCFDISLLELLLPLVSGGIVDVASRECSSNPHATIARLKSRTPTYLFSTPSRLELLFNAGWKGNLSIQILTGGERLSSEVASKLINGCRCAWNLYGPTETTILSTSIQSNTSVPSHCIGRPISNTQVYVLDSGGELVPIGVPGELYIGGDGLAHGYLNRPDLTAQRFVPNPFSKDPDSKLYRTGDLCRWRSDGNLEYLGRMDHQVKLRGFRIELGEIESILSEQPQISQSVVVLREDRPGDKKLVAYYTSKAHDHPSVASLREHLGSKLPEYMIPAAFVKLDALPLTPSGKCDRRSLPAPQQQDIGLHDNYTPPRNSIEVQLTQIWSEALGIDRIGIHDNFFALGGHSLLAVRLFARINERFKATLPLSLIFQGGTIAQLARSIQRTSKEKPFAELIPLSEFHEGPALIVLPGLNGELLYSKSLVERIGRPINVIGLQPHLDTQHINIYGDFKRLASQYVKTLLASQHCGPFRFIGYSYGGILGFEIARQLRELKHEVSFVGIIDTGIDPAVTIRDPIPFGQHLVRAVANLPRWTLFNCGPENRKKTLRKLYFKTHYYFRWFASMGKAKFGFEDEFGTHSRHDGRREILRLLFRGLIEYVPEFFD